MATSYPVQRRLFGLAAKIETTYGADSTPTFTTNAIRLLDRPTVNRNWLAPNTRENWFTGGLGELASVSPSGEWHEIDFQAVIHGAGAAYSATALPSAHPFLLAAGFSAAFTSTGGSESYTYDYTDSPATGLTVYTRMDGVEYKTVGSVVSEWSISASAGEYPVFTGKLQGYAHATALAEVDIGTHTLPSTVPPIFAAATVAISSYNPVIRSFELSGGNQVAGRGDGRGSAGHAGFRITRRQPSFVPRVEAADITDFNPSGDWAAATQRTLDMTIGSTQYNKYAIDADDMRVVDFAEEDDEGLTIVQPTYRIFTPSSGNELRITFD